MTATVLVGDAVEQLRTLPAGSVQACVTSPPYFGLRDYGTGDWENGDPDCDHRGAPMQSHASTLAGNGHGNGKRLSPTLQAQAVPVRECRCGARRVDRQIGLEDTPDAYVERLVAVFREVRRVLRDDGTVWLNLGDSYYSPTATQGRNERKSPTTSTLADHGSDGRSPALDVQTPSTYRRSASGIKPKDLLGIPWLVAFALRADGWWLRADIVWAKTAPMPESVRDRPTRSHEFVFLLTKQPRYFYDHDAIREPALQPPGVAHSTGQVKTRAMAGTVPGHRNGLDGSTLGTNQGASGRNKRDVWTLGPEQFADAHFAVMPTKLVEPCVLAGSPPKCCGECGAPWSRVTEREAPDPADMRPKDPRIHLGHSPKSTLNQSNWHDERTRRTRFRSVGWRPTCAHDDDTGRAVVLDPFCGSGTVGVVCGWHGRDFIGCELNGEYARMARDRIALEGRPGGRPRHEPVTALDGQLDLLAGG